MKTPAWLLFAGIALAAAALVWREVPPAEDAAMLMRYIRNLAGGHGWVWNPGGPPEDGATDALFVMLAAAAVRMTRLEPEWVVRGLNVLAHLALLGIIFRRWVTDFRFSPLLAGLLLIPLIAGPATCFIPAGFPTPFFALVIAVFFLEAWKGAITPALALWGFLVCLARPEGLFLVGPALGVLLWQSADKRQAFRILVWPVAAGIGWLMVRQGYFGHVFPTPFYRKGGEINLVNGIRSVYLGGMHVLPWLPLLLGGWFLHPRHRMMALLPAAVFLAMFALLSNEMNFAARFQYAVVPGLLLSPWMETAARWAGKVFAFGGNHLCVIAGMLLVMSGFAFSWFRYAGDRDSLQTDVRDAVGRELHAWQHKGYRLATTEAGLLPYRSGWQTLDVWGLNAYEIARTGVVTQARLRAFAPTLVMLDEHVIAERRTAWLAMNDTLLAFVRQQGYEPIGSYAPPGDSLAHRYWVDRHCPDAEALAAAISRALKQP